MKKLNAWFAILLVLTGLVFAVLSIKKWQQNYSLRLRLQDEAVWLARNIPEQANSNKAFGDFLDAATTAGNIKIRRWEIPNGSNKTPDVIVISKEVVNGERIAVYKDRSIKWINRE
jgi:hypothetical protein